jgi:hypothetical protein
MVGAQIFKQAGAALRYMDDPTRDGISIGNVHDYYAGLDVHYSSGIYNKAFYVLAHRAGWDVRKAFDVFLKANQDYWVPSETFYAGAVAVRQAAQDLAYSTADVEYAFLQVGIDLTQPFVQILAPAGNDSATTTYTIRWSDYDPNHAGSISLYYDTNNSGLDGTLIVGNLSGAADTGSYSWNVTSLPHGTYYVYAVMTSGATSTTAYSTGTVTILSPDIYEPDDTYQQASTIALNSTQLHHSIVPATDYDWVRFDVLSVPTLIVLETHAGPGAGTRACGCTTAAARINWRITTTGEARVCPRRSRIRSTKPGPTTPKSTNTTIRP